MKKIINIELRDNGEKRSNLTALTSLLKEGWVLKNITSDTSKDASDYTNPFLIVLERDFDIKQP